MALTDGTLTPVLPGETRFVEIARSQRSPGSEVEKEWLRFVAEHPELRNEP